MKKIFTLIPVLAIFALVSCQQHVIEYDTKAVDPSTQAEVKLVYDLGIVTSGAPTITRLTYNGNLYSEVSSTLGSYIPYSTAKFHVVPVGPLQIDAYTGTTKDVPLYSNTTNITSGRWAAFVYDLNQAPLFERIPDVLPTSSFDPWADTACTIQFVNLLEGSDGVTPVGQLTLKARRGSGTTASPYVYTTIATANFGEASDYVRFDLLSKGIKVWSGTETSIAFVLYDANGNLLSTFTSSNASTSYAATGYSLTKGLNYIFHLNGRLGTNYATTSIRLSSITLN